MRPAVLPVELCSPCCSGRGLPDAVRTRSKRHTVAVSAIYGSQRPQQAPQVQQQAQAQGAAGRRPAAPPNVATGAYSATMSFATSSSVTEMREDVQQQQQQRQQVAVPAPVRLRQRDADGILQQRQRPLKINLDLALYRARQKRIAANLGTNRHNRARLLREVEAALLRCKDLFPEDGRPYVSLGKLYVQQRRYDEALAIYEEGCTATGGTNAHIWAAWAYLAARQGNVALARRLYDAALVASPQHAAAWHGWGLLEKDQGNYLRARDLWLKGIQALRASPNAYLYQSLAVLAAEMDCVEEARKWFREGTRTVMGRASHALWQAWALMEQRQGDRSLVRALLKRGLEASPRSRYAHLAWALWEKEEGQIEEARRLFKAGAAKNPQDAAILQAWAIMEEEQGQVEHARRLFRRASKADPKHLYVWQAWGCMEYRQQNYDTARELFQQGIWAAAPRDPSVSLVFQAWALLERDAGNTQLARELLKCAVKADPKSEPSWLLWASMEEDQGFVQRAAELRSYSMQERVEVVKPANFSTGVDGRAGGLLGPIFTQIASWFQRYDEEGRRAEPELPELLPLESLREEAVGGDAAAPARPQRAAAGSKA